MTTTISYPKQHLQVARVLLEQAQLLNDSNESDELLLRVAEALVQLAYGEKATNSEKLACCFAAAAAGDVGKGASS